MKQGTISKVFKPRPYWIYKQPLTQFFSCQVFREDAEKQNQPQKVIVLSSSKDGNLREILHESTTKENKIAAMKQTLELDAFSRKKYEHGNYYS